MPQAGAASSTITITPWMRLFPSRGVHVTLHSTGLPRRLVDGTAGLQAIKEAGGIAVVQDPVDATCASLPSHAMDRVAIDYCVKSANLADLLVRLVHQPAPDPGPPSPVPLETRDEAEGTAEFPITGAVVGVESGLACPECSGILREVREGEVLRFRCRVGHAYTSQTMLEAQGDAIERALWTAVRQLEERALLMRKLAAAASERGHDAIATTFEDRSIALTQEVAFSVN